MEDRCAQLELINGSREVITEFTEAIDIFGIQSTISIKQTLWPTL